MSVFVSLEDLFGYQSFDVDTGLSGKKTRALYASLVNATDKAFKDAVAAGSTDKFRYVIADWIKSATLGRTVAANTAEVDEYFKSPQVQQAAAKMWNEIASGQLQNPNTQGALFQLPGGGGFGFKVLDPNVQGDLEPGAKYAEQKTAAGFATVTATVPTAPPPTGQAPPAPPPPAIAPGQQAPPTLFAAPPAYVPFVPQQPQYQQQLPLPVPPPYQQPPQPQYQDPGSQGQGAQRRRERRPAAEPAPAPAATILGMSPTAFAIGTGVLGLAGIIFAMRSGGGGGRRRSRRDDDED